MCAPKFTFRQSEVVLYEEPARKSPKLLEAGRQANYNVTCISGYIVILRRVN
jgi:hypothetical protein